MGADASKYDTYQYNNPYINRKHSSFEGEGFSSKGLRIPDTKMIKDKTNFKDSEVYNGNWHGLIRARYEDNTLL